MSYQFRILYKSRVSFSIDRHVIICRFMVTIGSSMTGSQTQATLGPVCTWMGDSHRRLNASVHAAVFALTEGEHAYQDLTLC